MDNVRREPVRVSMPDITWAADCAVVMHEPALDLTPAEIYSLIAHYGMPPPEDAYWRRVRYQGDELASLWGNRWKGYQIVGLGVEGGDPTPLFMAVGDIKMQMYLVRVGRHDTPLYLEAVWRPGDRARISLGGLEHPHTAADVRRVHAGRALLKKILHSGRPTGTGTFADAAAFVRTIGQAVAAVKKQGRSPTQANVVLYFSQHSNSLHPDDRQIRQWLKYFGYESWKALLTHINSLN